MLTLTQGQQQERASFRVPHPNRLGFVEIPQARWVRTEFQVDCDDLGYPTRVHIRKPSTALELVQLPLKVLRSIIALPAQLFQFRINLQQGRMAAAQSDAAYQQSMKEMREQVEALRRERQEQTRAVQKEDRPREGAPERETPAGGQPTTVTPRMSEGNIGEWEDVVRKLQQDVMILRKRINAKE